MLHSAISKNSRSPITSDQNRIVVALDHYTIYGVQVQLKVAFRYTFLCLFFKNHLVIIFLNVCMYVCYRFSRQPLNRLLWNLAWCFEMVPERQLSILVSIGCVIIELSHMRYALYWTRMSLATETVTSQCLGFIRISGSLDSLSIITVRIFVFDNSISDVKHSSWSSWPWLLTSIWRQIVFHVISITIESFSLNRLFSRCCDGWKEEEKSFLL